MIGESSAITVARDGIAVMWEPIPALKTGSMFCKIMNSNPTQIKDAIARSTQKWAMDKATDRPKQQGMQLP
jgi:hypothetical protein